MRISSVCAVALAGLNTVSAAAAEPEIEKLAWLAGCWKNESAEPGSASIGHRSPVERCSE